MLHNQSEKSAHRNDSHEYCKPLDVVTDSFGIGFYLGCQLVDADVVFIHQLVQNIREIFFLLFFDN